MKNSIGIALSGGGFRAAAFHLGTLNKLQELGVLSEARVISSISGGSIAGAYYGLK
jgi:NTE family protein